MDDMEFNKVFAAILTAGIIAMFAGFLADLFVHPEKLKEDAYIIEAKVAHTGGEAAAPVGPEPILALLANADIEKGQKLSKACAACHSFDKGGADKVGPNLWNIVNRPIGGSAGFAYSDALSNTGEAWTYDNLNAFLWKPKKSYPGTKMNYIGLKKPEQRANIIGWLRTLSDRPAALPQ